MRTIVFSGPTISEKQILERIDASILPPISQGDTYYSVTELKPHRIIIIDGVYENVPTVWLKEILFALSKGIEVIGAASIGALRAADLHSFGMKGYGKIFGDFKDNILEDDDEVAVLHGPKELGYPPVSDAMVNIRYSLQNACEIGLLEKELCSILLSEAKDQFFKKRNYKFLLEAHEKVLGKARVETLINQYIDQKRIDALQLFECLANGVPVAGKEPKFSFLETAFFRYAFKEL